MGEVERLLRGAPGMLPSETCVVVESTCSSVRELLGVSETTMQELTGAFGGSGSGVRTKVKSIFHRTSRANAFNAKMSTVETQVHNSSQQLLQIVSVLALALESQETGDANVGDNSKRVYRRPVTSAPALRHTVVLDFNVRDADGEPATPEGKLKQSVLSSLSSTEVTAAAGVMKPTYGIVGMGGVGKTIALQGLAYDEDIRKRFVDGVLYMSLGQDASVQRVMREIGRILRISGGRDLRSLGSLRDVIDEAVMWFSEKVCLFLVDDLWPTATCATGYLRIVQEVLRESPKSRIAITTRSVEIARDAGSVVQFDAREPTGSVLRTLFMKYATVSLPVEAYTEVGREVESSVLKVLSLRGGLPIALAVTGCGVANLASIHGTSYVVELEERAIRVGEEKMAGCSSLNAGIILSLECLAENWRVGEESEHSIMDLYTSLCVLENQGWIPVSVLRRLLPLRPPATCSPCGLYIAAVASNRRDIAVVDAISGDILQRLKGHTGLVSCITFGGASTKIVSGSDGNTVAVWKWDESASPVQVLEGHIRRVSYVDLSRDGRRIFSVSDDGTLRVWDADSGRQECMIQVGEWSKNFCVTALAVCGKGRSVAVRLRNGAMKVVDTDTGATEYEDDGTQGRNVWCMALSPNGGLLVTGSRESIVRLWNSETWTRVGEVFEGHEDAVWSIGFSPDEELKVSGGGDGCIRVWSVGTGKSISVSPNLHSPVGSVLFNCDGKRIISGARFGGTVRIWDAMLGTKSERRDYGHSARVWDVGISGDGMRVVSGSGDGTVRLWDSETGARIGVPLEGHKSSVICVSLSRNGRHVVSGSRDGTLILWDAEKFAQIWEPLQGHTSCMQSVSFSFDGCRIASGSFDRTVRVWNVASREQMGDAIDADLESIYRVSESCDGRHDVARGLTGSIMWDRERRAVVRRSTGDTISAGNEMSDDEAKVAVHSCGHETPRVWPYEFPAYTAELYCKGNNNVYSNILGGKTVLGTLPSGGYRWRYDSTRKVLAA